MQTLVTASYKLPAELAVTTGCFGKSVRVEIGGLTGRARLPELSWLNGEPTVTAPAMDPDARSALLRRMEMAGDSFRWGDVGSWNSNDMTVSMAYVSALMLDFKVRSTDITYGHCLHGRGYPEGPSVERLFSNIDPWFDRVRTWVEAITEQDADTSNPLDSITVPGGGLLITTNESGTVSLPASAKLIMVTTVETEPIKLPKLRKAVGKANVGEIPSDAHLLLRDSRAAARRGQFRRAVIDAGSATELTLADFNRRVTSVNTGPRPTLGWYVDQPIIASRASLPANTKADLVNLRNDAIHKHKTPTRTEAILAVSIGGRIINNLDPLPI